MINVLQLSYNNLKFTLILLMAVSMQAIAQSPGEDCTNAIDITANITSTCNTFSNTNDFGPIGSLEDACGNAGDQALWFSFVAPHNGFVDVTSTNDSYTPDTDLQIGSGACGSIVCIDGDDDGGTSFTSLVLGAEVTAGQTYYIQWSDQWGDVPGTWDLRYAAIPDLTIGTTDVIVSNICGNLSYEYGPAPLTAGTGTAGTSTTIAGLTEATDYEICFNSCDAFGTGDASCGWTDTGFPIADTQFPFCRTFTTQSSCLSPSNLVVTDNVADGIVDISFLNGGGDGNYEIEWGAVGFTPGTNTFVGSEMTTDTVKNIANLTCGSILEFYVRDNCAAYGSSLWVGPVLVEVDCPPPAPVGVSCSTANTFPTVVLLEEFDGVFGAGWTSDSDWQFDPDGTTSFDTGPSGPHSGSHYIYYETSGGVMDSAEIVSPAIDLTGALDQVELTFWYHMHGESIGALDIQVSDDGGASYTSLFSIIGEQQSDETEPFNQIGLSLTSYIGSVIQLRLVGIYGGDFTGDIGVDLLEVTTCSGCSTSVATTSTIDDCANFEFDALIDITDFGTATSIDIYDNILDSVLATVSAADAMPFNLGTFPAGTDLDIDLIPDDAVLCTNNLPTFSSPCFKQGEDCSAAIDIPVTDCFVSITGAEITPGVGTAVETDGDGSLWYSITPPADLILSYASCNGGSDTETALFDGGATPGICPVAGDIAVVENDDACASGLGNNFASEINGETILAGNTYYIEWGNQWDEGPFDWNLTFECAEGTISGLTAAAGADSTSEIDLSFTAPGSATVLFEYGPSGFALGTGTAMSGVTSPINVTGLATATSYDFYVYYDCIGLGTVGSCAQMISAFTLSDCAAPVGIAATDSPVESQLNVTWSNGGGAGNYTLEWGAPGFVPGSGTEVGSGSVLNYTMFDIDNLPCGSSFDVYVKDDCSGTASVWNGPATALVECAPTPPIGTSCAAGTFPNVIWTEDFNTTAPAGWSGNIGTGNGAWNVTHSGGTSSTNTGPLGAFNGNNYAYFESSGSPAQVTNLITAPIDLTNATGDAEFSFWYHMFGSDLGDLQIQISNDGGSTWTTLFTILGEQQPVQTDPWQQFGLNIAAYLGQTIQFQFNAIYGGGYNSDIAIDLIQVSSCSTCSGPTATVDAVCNSTSTFDIELEITDPGTVNTMFEIFADGAATGIMVPAANGVYPLSLSFPQDVPVSIELVGDLDLSCVAAAGTAIFTDCSCFGSFPANDECDDVEALGAVLAVGSCDGTVVSATSDFTCAFPGADSQLPSCDGTTGNNDVFYSFIAPANGSITINVVSGDDLEGAVYDACPGNSGVELDCFGNTSAGDFENISGLTPGNTYVLQLWNDSFAANVVDICIEEGPGTAVNNVCATPTPISVFADGTCNVNAASFTTIGATTASSGDGDPSCDQFGDNLDVWFEFTAPASGVIEVNLDNTAGGTGTLEFAIYEACPLTGGAEVFCHTDFADNVSEIVPNLVSGNTYFMQVWTDANENTFDLCVTEVSCLAPSFSITPNCTANNGYELNIVITDEGTGNDSGFEVFVDGISTGVTIDSAGQVVLVPGPFATGTAIDIELIGLDDATCPAQELGFDTDCSCFGAEPANDECVNAIEILSCGFNTPSVNGPYTNVCATVGVEGVSEFPFSTVDVDWIDAQYDNTVWFLIEGNGSDITLTTNNTDPGINNPMTDSQMAVFTSCPDGGGSYVTGDDDASPNGFMSQLTFTSVLGVDYYVLVDGWNGNEGGFTIDAECQVPPCAIQATQIVQPCNGDGSGTFDVGLNIFATDFIGTDIVATDQNGDTISVFPYFDPFTSQTVAVDGTGTDDISITLTAADQGSCSFTLPPISAPECATTCEVGGCPNEIGNVVYLDLNSDGDYDPNFGETGVAGVEVYLLDSLGNAVDTTLTQMDGTYTFTNVLPGVMYSIQFDLPLAYAGFTQSSGCIGCIDSDVDAQGNTIAFMIDCNTICDPLLPQLSENLGAGLIPADCPSLFSFTATANEVCDGEAVDFTAVLNPATADNAVLTLNVMSNGMLMPLGVAQADATGTYVFSINAENSSCIPATTDYVLSVLCLDDSSIVAIQTEDVTVYPTAVEQFITIVSSDDCSASVQVDPSCTQNGVEYLSLTSAATQFANEGDAGTFAFTYEYAGNINVDCSNFSGSVDVAYDCPLTCTNDAGIFGSGGVFLCDGDFTSLNPFGVVIDPGSTLTFNIYDEMGNLVVSQDNSDVVNDGLFNYNETYCATSFVTDSAGLCVSESPCLNIVFLSPIEITATPVCNDLTGMFTVEVSIAGGGPEFFSNHTYALSGATLNYDIAPGTTAVAGPFASETEFVLDVLDDGKGCQASITVTDTCEVLCDAGVVPNSPQFACDGQTVAVAAVGFQVGANTSLNYVIHDGYNNVIAQNNSGVFINNGNTAPRNVELCLSSVIVDPITGDICDFSNCQPLVFLDPVVISSTEVCDEATGEYIVSANISGGGPGYNAATYQYSVSINGEPAQVGNINTTFIGGTYLGPDGYSVEVLDDGKGCGAFLEKDSVDCKLLPIELLSFTGEAIDEGNMLKWITATELNNDYFTLDYSVNGAEFNYLTTVDGAGTTSQQQAYSFLDVNAPTGVAYYRLSQTDFDGTTVISGVVEIYRATEQFEILDLYPNPVLDQLNLIFNAAEIETVDITIFDSKGKLMEDILYQTQAGINTQTLNVSYLAAGVYVVKISNNEKVLNYRFVKN